MDRDTNKPESCAMIADWPHTHSCHATRSGRWDWGKTRYSNIPAIDTADPVKLYAPRHDTCASAYDFIIMTSAVRCSRRDRDLVRNR